jgi:hypothetical protein
MLQKIDEIQVILMLEETLKYDWVQHLKILTPPDDNSWIYVRADGLLPPQVTELLEIYTTEFETYKFFGFDLGLWIYVEGRHWMYSYAAPYKFFEEWFAELRRIVLLRQDSETSVCTSNDGVHTVILSRKSEQLSLKTTTLGYRESSISVNLWDFTSHLLKAGEAYLQLIEKLFAAIEVYDKSKNSHAELTRIVEVLDRVGTDHFIACLDEIRSELVKQANT